ncbi:MAG TPA: TRAP transporter small permease [Kofleriaceae bacterium]
MSEPDDQAIPRETEVPPTRQHPIAASGADAPPGQSSLSIEDLGGAHTFPDDGTVSHGVRRLDRYLGVVEQVVLFVMLAAVVLTASAAAVADKAFHTPLGRWTFDIIRGGTFSMAMVGAAFASHQQRHLSMDLVSRRLPARGQLILRVVLGLFTIFVAVLLVWAGGHLLDAVGDEGGDHIISTHSIVRFLPIGAILIIVHTVMHMIIDIDYLVRGKAPPERARAH